MIFAMDVDRQIRQFSDNDDVVKSHCSKFLEIVWTSDKHVIIHATKQLYL